MKWNWRLLRRFIYLLLALSYFLGVGLVVGATSLSGNEIGQEMGEEVEGDEELPAGSGGQDLEVSGEDVLSEEELHELYVLLQSQQSVSDDDASETLPRNSLSGNNIYIMPLSDYDAYDDGTISSTYIDLFERICDKFDYRTHYVAFRSDRYNYVLAYGSDLSYDGSTFSGTDMSVVTVNTYNGTTISYGTESTFSLNPSNYIIYSDLGDFPSLDKGVSNVEIYALLFFAGFFVVYSVCHDIFDYVMSIYRK